MKFYKYLFFIFSGIPLFIQAQQAIENNEEDGVVQEMQEQRMKKLFESAGTQNLSLLNYRAVASENAKNNTNAAQGYTPLNGNWTQINTAQSSWGMGRINCFAVDPVNANTIYTGTPTGGLWKTTDNGTNWQNLSSAMGVPGVSGICIDPNNTNILYMLTGSASSVECQSLGVFKSTDGGANWTATGLDSSYVTNWFNTPPQFNANKLVMDPTNSSILFAAMTTGLYRTADAGVTWTQVYSIRSVRDVVFHPTNHNIVYIVNNVTNSSHLEILVSENNGVTFPYSTNLPAIPTAPYYYASCNLAVTAAAPDSIFFAATVPSTVTTADEDSIFVLRAKYNSVSHFFNFGTRKKCLINGGPDYANSALRWYRDARIAVSSSSTADLYVSGLWTYASSNYGNTWVNKYLTGGGVETIHSDATQISYINGFVYASNDGGIYRQSPSTTNPTQAWSILSGTMPISQIFKLGASQLNSTNFVTALQDNGNHSISALTYELLIGGDGIMARMSPNTPGTYYYRPNNYVTYRMKAGTISDISPYGNVYVSQFGMFEVDQANENRIYTAKKHLYISTAQGNAGSWTTKTTTATYDNKLMAASKTNNQVFWLLESEGYDVAGNLIANAVLRRTIDGGTNFSIVTLPAAIPINLISSIVISPYNENKLFITVDGYNANAKVFETSNASTASPANIVWNNLSSNQLPNVPALCLAFESSADNSVYLGTEIGMYYFNTVINRWIPFNNGMPVCRVNDLYINYASLKVIAATYGRGIFISDFYGTCATTLNLSGNQSGNLTFSAGTTLNSSAQLTGGEASRIKYYSGTDVFLTPGFNINSSSNFLATIGPCGGKIDPILNSLVKDTAVLKQKNVLPIDSKSENNIGDQEKKPISSFTPIIKNQQKEIEKIKNQ